MAQTLVFNTSVGQVVPVALPTFDEDMEIIGKLDDEPNDIGGLSAQDLKDEFDLAGKSVQTFLNDTLIPAVVADDMTEQARREAEAERVSNEIERVSHENARVSEESGRIARESARVSAESARVSNESARVSAESARVAAEQERADENTGIVAQATEAKNGAVAAKEQTETLLNSVKGVYLGEGDMPDGYVIQIDPNGEGAVTAITAYEIAKEHGFSGTEEEWLASLKGEQGEPGADGAPGEDGHGVPEGGAAGQILRKKSNEDFDTEWADPDPGGDNTFIADYGVTSYADVQAAYSAGKVVYASRSGRKYICSGKNSSNNCYYFYSWGDGTSGIKQAMYIRPNNSWNTTSVAEFQMKKLAQTVTDSEEEYPSCAAVKAYAEHREKKSGISSGEILTPDTEYFVGEDYPERTDLRFVLPDSPRDGSIIIVNAWFDSTPSLVIEGSVLGFDEYSPQANTVASMTFKAFSGNWIMTVSSVAIS